MREIRFKAIEINNKKYEDRNGGFTYGYLLGKNFIGERHLCFEIDPNTICQFIGLYDIDYKEIYEGDIVELGKEDSKYYNIPDVPYTVIYSNKFAGFFLRRLDTDKEERDYLRDISANIVKKYKIKIIGNIYESRK